MAWEPIYATTAELASYARIADSIDDDQIDLALESASRVVDRTCRRQFGLSAPGTPRIYRPHWDAYLQRVVVDIDDLSTEVGLSVSIDVAGDGGFATPLTNYSLRPVNALADGRPWECLSIAPGSPVLPSLVTESVRVVGRLGWASVPDTVKQATLLQASRILSRRDAPFGISGSPSAGQGEMRLLARIDPDVAVLLSDFKRRRGMGFA